MWHKFAQENSDFYSEFLSKKLAAESLHAAAAIVQASAESELCQSPRRLFMISRKLGEEGSAESELCQIPVHDI